MTLSFMSLPVIPKLRLTTRGVSDVGESELCAKQLDHVKLDKDIIES